jgi:plasmid stability protein
MMPDLLIRDLDAKVVARLEAQAKRNGRSLQGEVKGILESAAGLSMAEALAAAGRLRASLGRKFGDRAALIRLDRRR